MTIEAEGHREGFYLRHDFHLIDPTMTFDAAYPVRHVSAVIEVNVIRKIVNSFPGDRLLSGEALAKRSERQAFASNRADANASVRISARMAVGTGCGRRDCGMCRFVDRIMTIATVEFQLSRVNLMAERDRLFRLMSNAQRFRGRRSINNRADVHAACY